MNRKQWVGGGILAVFIGVAALAVSCHLSSYRVMRRLYATGKPERCILHFQKLDSADQSDQRIAYMRDASAINLMQSALDNKRVDELRKWVSCKPVSVYYIDNGEFKALCGEAQRYIQKHDEMVDAKAKAAVIAAEAMKEAERIRALELAAAADERAAAAAKVAEARKEKERVRGIARAEAAAISSRTPQNSAWDGSVSQVKDYLRKVLNDPYSVKYEEWSPVSKTATGFAVRCKYRAKNSFGAYILAHQIFDMDTNGNVTGYTDWK